MILRAPRFALLLLAGVVALAACSSDEDPLKTKCEQSCGVADTHPCADKRGDCVKLCRDKAGAAQALGYRGEACGACVAGLVKLAGKICKSATELCTFGGTETCEPRTDCGADDEQCFGAVTPEVTATAVKEPSCQADCLEPDAGVRN